MQPQHYKQSVRVRLFPEFHQDKDRPACLILMPSYNNHAHQGATDCVWHCPTYGKLRVGRARNAGSLLAMTFNVLWVTALDAFKTGHFQYAAMCHSDIEAMPGWLDVLYDEMQATGADFMSAVVPIKENSGDTSTAVGDVDDPWDTHRMTFSDLQELPETFSADDLPPGQQLLANSGLWIANLASPCFHELNEDGDLKCLFTIKDRIRVVDGEYQVGAVGEDWGFSRMISEAGGKVFCTTKVSLMHYGEVHYAYMREDAREKIYVPS